MHLGLRPRVHFPADYKGFALLKTHGRIYAVPPPLDPVELLKVDALFTHPAALSAGTLEEVQALIDRFDAQQQLPQFLDTFDGYNLVRFRGSLLAVRQSAGDVDLDSREDRQRGGVVTGRSLEELRERIRQSKQGEPIEFAGWLPIFEFSGRCGRHPQFAHTGEPPEGYRFTCSAPPPRRRSRLAKKIDAALEAAGKACVKAFLAARPTFSMLFGGPRVGVKARVRVLGAVARLGAKLVRRGCRVLPVLKFLQSRHFHSQLLLERSRGLVFLTSMPYTYGQRPWVVEIEDPTTLFYPLIQNGHTSWLDLKRSPYYPIIKTLLEDDSCKGILTHMRSTARMVPTLFESDVITKKVQYAPLGVKVPPRWQRHEEKDPDEIHLLFINSWCQIPENFYLRGGLDVLEAFAVLRERYPQLRLTMRTSLPALADPYQRILEEGGVRIISRFLTGEEMAQLHLKSHIYLLPAARVHIVSLLQAMSYGLATVASDGWGIEEYIDHERNGLVVKGRYGKAAWADEEVGMLRENYETMHTPSPEVTQGIIDAVSRLVEEHELRARLGRAARADVEAKYTLAQWNEGLKAAFDRARGVDGVVWASSAIRDVQEPSRQDREALVS
jgi:hypothetical protein